MDAFEIYQLVHF